MLNNPLRLVDPSGHYATSGEEDEQGRPKPDFSWRPPPRKYSLTDLYEQAGATIDEYGDLHGVPSMAWYERNAHRWDGTYGTTPSGYAYEPSYGEILAINKASRRGISGFDVIVIGTGVGLSVAAVVIGDGREFVIKPPTIPDARGTRFITGQRVYDKQGNLIDEGTVDLQPTFDRIGAGQKYPHRNDGTVFRNDGTALPKQAPGYYKEYVVPTPGQSGPGPQRLVVGAGGEAYYTPDHYQTFIRVR